MRRLNNCWLFLILLPLISSAQTDSVVTQYLKAEVDRGNSDALLRIARPADPSVLGYLTVLAADEKARIVKGTVAYKAHVALARLGDPVALRAIDQEIDLGEPRIQDNAMNKLYIVGGRSAFQKFYQLLDDTRTRVDPDCERSVKAFKKLHPEGGNCSLCCDVVYETRSTMAMWYLSKMVDDPPTPKNHVAMTNDIPLWKDWFARHKEFIP